MKCNLTKKQMRVLGMLAEGLSNKEIALNLENSVRTVEVIRREMLLKTRAKNSLNLIHISHKKGWLE